MKTYTKCVKKGIGTEAVLANIEMNIERNANLLQNCPLVSYTYSSDFSSSRGTSEIRLLV